jgi:hypothetical protein
MILSIEDQDKSWVERKAREQGVSMAEVVRNAVRQMRQSDQGTLEQVLKATQGIWRDGDGLAYQRRLRREWK